MKPAKKVQIRNRYMKSNQEHFIDDKIIVNSKQISLDCLIDPFDFA